MNSLAATLDRLCFRYPSLLIDEVAEHEPGRRLVAIKNVTVNEEFSQGHFPGVPLMPAVLMVEALAQAATLLIEGDPHARQRQVTLRGVDRAKFRRQVVPGDRLRLQVQLVRRRGSLVKALVSAEVDGQPVAEAELVLTIGTRAIIDPAARVHPRARIGSGTTVGPYAVIGPDVTVGRECTIGASAVIEGRTTLGDHNHISPFASIGLPPQDLKYRGEHTALEIGSHNTFREFVTIHRGTVGGGGRTSIGDRNLFMGYVHVAHDCRVGTDTIFGPHATLGGHVAVGDFANISAGSAVHQFCRVGRYAFIGGYSVVTKDALPYARTVGSRPARVFGVNTVGLIRRGFSPDAVAKLKRAFRYLLQSKLNASQALQQIESDPTLACEHVTDLVDFIRSATRGAILRRRGRTDGAFGED